MIVFAYDRALIIHFDKERCFNLITLTNTFIDYALNTMNLKVILQAALYHMQCAIYSM